MKKILFSLTCCLMTIGASAVETTDYIKLSAATVNPGGDEVEITVSLEGSNTELYAGYNMDIFIPDGLELLQYSTYNEDDEEYTYNYCNKLVSSTGGINKSSHSIGSEIVTISGKRALRVACFSQSNATLKANTGNLFTIKVKASSFTKPGAAQITIDGVALKVAGGSEYDPAARVDENVTISSDATASLTVSSTNKWSTCILPFDVALPEGVKAYTCTEKDEANSVLKLNEANSIEAYTPYILYSENGYSGSLTGTVDATKYPESGYVTKGYLNGAIITQEITEGYVLQNLDGSVKFYNCGGSTFTIPAGKCWVKFTSGEDAKSLNFEFSDAAGIYSVNTVSESKTGTYTLSGQKVDSMRSGSLYIQDGKKFVKH